MPSGAPREPDGAPEMVPGVPEWPHRGRKRRILLWPHPLKGGYVQMELHDDEESEVTGRLGALAAAQARQAMRDRYGLAADRVLGELDASVERLGDFYVPRDRRIDQVVYGGRPGRLPARPSMAAPTWTDPASTTRDVDSTEGQKSTTNDDDFWAALASSPGLPRWPDHDLADSQSGAPAEHDPYFAVLDTVAAEADGHQR